MNNYHYWRELEPIVDEALNLESEKRSTFLESECAHQPWLLNEALDFLCYIEQAENKSFLDVNNPLYAELHDHLFN